MHVSIMTEQETGRRLSVGRGGEDMLLNTYKKVMELFESGNGYRDASELKDAKITTVQIKELVNMGIKIGRASCRERV